MLDHEARERRLVGDGDDASGGGLPLSEAFTAVLQHLHEHRNDSFAGLTIVIMNKAAYKEKRILALYRTWEDFSDDVLSQLLHRQLIKADGDDWALGDEVVTDVLYPVLFPQGRGIINAIIVSEDTQAERNKKAAFSMKVTTLEAEFRASGMLTDEKEEAFRTLRKGLEITLPAKPKRKTLETGLQLGLADFYRKYAETHGWHKMTEAAKAWEAEHESSMGSAYSLDANHQGSMRRMARILSEEGKLVRSDFKWKQVNETTGGRKTARGYYYCWVGNEGDGPPPP